jgi:hypothetical protein
MRRLYTSEMKLRAAILAFGIAVANLPAGAQCAMCYQSAAGAGQKAQTALTRGVVMLLIPPVGMMAAFVGFAVRRARREDDGNQ